MAASSKSAILDAEAFAADLPPLLIAADRVAATVAQGIHGRRRVGSGHSFWQFRAYLPGDPTNRIDWRETGKSERAFIREEEWDAAQSVWIWLDQSPSMRWRSGGRLPHKSERAELLTLATAALLLRAGDRVAFLGSGAAPSIGRAVLRRIFNEIGRAKNASGILPSQVLPRHASLILIGDFLDPIETIKRSLDPYLQRGVRGHLLQVLDPAEEDLPYDGRVRFDGMEKEGSLIVSRTESVRDAYRRRLVEQRDALALLTRRAGWSFASHRTDKPPQSALLALWALLSGNIGDTPARGV